MDAIIQRLRRNAQGNQLAIAVGHKLSEAQYSIPFLSQEIIKEFNISYKVRHSLEYFQYWNQLVKEAEKKVKRKVLFEFLSSKVKNVTPKKIHKKIASLPISNFIDTTFDRSLYKALVQNGKKPILHDWNSQSMGSWKQSNPHTPNIFFSLVNLEDFNPWYGVYAPISLNSQNCIQIENMMEMLNNKDFLLLDFNSMEAEFILHLYSLIYTSNKVVNTASLKNDPVYWNIRGVNIIEDNPDKIIDFLLPYKSEGYSFWDLPFPGKKLIEINRSKQYDCFISYFSGDKSFAKRIAHELSLRGLHIWRDDNEIEVGDSFTDKIQKGLIDSYSFMIILSPEALSRPWVKEELRAAYVLRLAGEFKILPVLYKECKIPPFLVDYKYADFRDERRFHEQISLLERSIKNAVAYAREKK